MTDSGGSSIPGWYVAARGLVTNAEGKVRRDVLKAGFLRRGPPAGVGGGPQWR